MRHRHRTRRANFQASNRGGKYSVLLKIEKVDEKVSFLIDFGASGAKINQKTYFFINFFNFLFKIEE